MVTSSTQLRHNRPVSSDREARAARITIARYESSEEADRHDVEFWRRLPDGERVLQAWRLSLELWSLGGHPPYEPGLSRSVTRVCRR